MLRIDLLPPHIRDRRRVPLYLAICGVIFVVLALGLGVFLIGLTTKVSNLHREVEQLAVEAKAVDELNAQVTETQKTASLAEDRIKFVRAVQNTGPAWAAYISALSRWVPKNAYLSSWSIDGGKLQWGGLLLLFKPSEGVTSDEYMRFLIHIRRCPLLSDAQLTLEGLESGFSYPDGSSSYLGVPFVPFTVTGTLVGAPTPPEFKPAATAAAQPPAAAAPGAAMGGPGGAPGAGAAKPSTAAAEEDEELTKGRGGRGGGG